MPAAERILAVDIGTTTIKAVVFAVDGSIVRATHVATDARGPAAGPGEQHPDAVVDGVLQAIAQILQEGGGKENIRALAFSSQLYSVLAVDEQDRPLGPSLTWADNRAADIALAWRAEGLRLAEQTGCPPHSLYPLAKIAWMRRQPEYAKTKRFVSIKEYVIHRLAGEWLVDWQVASATGLLDVRAKTWCAPALDLAGIPADALSSLVSPRTRLPTWTAEALATGLPKETPGIIGGGDGPLGSLGLGAFATDILSINVGTSAAGRCLLEQPATDAQGRLWTYAVDDNFWVTGGIVSSGGAVFDWARRLAGNLSVEEALRAAAEVSHGADGLTFLPHLGGEQSPGWNPRATGSLHGLTYRHGPAHLLRAALEGIARSLERVASTIVEVRRAPLVEARAAGGLSASSLWCRIAADMLGLPLSTGSSPEASARGAAMLALLALGDKRAWADFADWCVAPVNTVSPDEAAHAFYAEQKATYLHLSSD